MGRGNRKRNNRKRNGAQGKNLTPATGDGKNLTASTADGKVSEPSLTVAPMASASDQKEKRIFDISSVRGEDNEQILHELPLQEIDNDAAAVGLDSQIYSIGGSCFAVDGSLAEGYGCTDGCNGGSHTSVFCVEVNGQANNKEWKPCPPMNIGRESPLACAVNGKIYVFGGARFGPFIGEVYDPVKEEWECLPPLEEFSAQSRIAPINVVLDDPKDATNKLILVHIREAKPLYAYNVRRNKWELLDEKFGPGPLYGRRPTSPVYGMSPTNAVVDNVLYCYSTTTSRWRFYAYDFKGKKWHNARSIPKSHQFHQTIDDNYDQYPSLFHLEGNTLCFLWSYPLFRGETRDVSIGCAKFTIGNDKFSLTQERVGHFDHEVHACGQVRYVLL
ncbi:Kelch repeat type 1 [Corchorus olitorius]|uniref:Kelch repeat type 1 n=1 Tax=Corchorus olitorius TaxID=93759 RepID=A0A1R3ID23_9ROSI|nr:Kelch repeat type 1 [Corchorus olitorius]